MYGARLLLALLMAVTTSQAAAKPAGNEAEIARLRGIFSNELAKLRLAHMQAEADWEREYQAALSALRKQAQLAGDLTGVLAVDKETQRFAAEKTIPAASLVAEPMALRNLQDTYFARKNEIVRRQYENVLKLRDLYVDRLSTKVQEHTRAGDIAKALAVNAEIERARQEPDVTAAEFAMADSSVDMEPEPTTAPLPATATPDDPADAAGPPPGVTIVEAQAAFADPAHYLLRESMVTGRPAAGAFRFRAWSGKRAHPSEPGLQQDVVRLWIAAREDGPALAGYVLRVTSFGKNKPPKFSFDGNNDLSNRLDKRIGYKKVGEMTIPLPPIVKTGLMVDFFPMSNPHGATDKLATSDGALDFGGIVFVLLNDKHQQAYRGATLRDLLKQAR
jgi:hypothetical protein